MDALSFTGMEAGGQAFLDPLEQVAVDDRLVAAWIDLTLEDDFAQVIAIAQQARHLGHGDRAGGPVGGRTGDETAISQFVDDVDQGVLARVIQLEGQPDEGSPFLVDLDGTDVVTIDAVNGVQVANRGPADGAAVLDLLRHLVGNICAVFTGAVLIEGSQNAVHQLADGSGVDLLGGGNKGDATLLEIGHDDGIIDAVASKARQLVDHHEVDIPVVANALQHLLEGDPFGHLSGRSTGFDVLANDVQAELVNLTAARHALGRNREAFWVVVGVDLPFR